MIELNSVCNKVDLLISDVTDVMLTVYECDKAIISRKNGINQKTDTYNQVLLSGKVTIEAKQ